MSRNYEEKQEQARRWARLRERTVEQQMEAAAQQVSAQTARLDAAYLDLGSATVDLRRFVQIQPEVWDDLAQTELALLHRSPALEGVEVLSASQLGFTLPSRIDLTDTAMRIHLGDSSGPWLTVSAGGMFDAIAEGELAKLNERAADPIFQGLAKMALQSGYGDLVPLLVAGLLMRQRRCRSRVALFGKVSDWLQNRRYQLASQRDLLPDQKTAEGKYADALGRYSAACQELARLHFAQLTLEEERQRVSSCDLQSEFLRISRHPLARRLSVQDDIGVVELFTHEIILPDENTPPILRRIGQFRMVVDTVRGIKVYNQDPRLLLANEGKHHPHIMTDGNCCFGQAASTIQKLLVTANLPDLLLYLLEFIGSINHASVFRKASFWPEA